MTSRYVGKPFLRLLDAYVLEAIGHLDAQQADALQAMESRLGAVYGTTGSWQQIVAAQMDFPQDLPAQIRRIWDNGNAKAAALGQAADPLEFTRQFVDTNFAP
jgi:hypothetical protein